MARTKVQSELIATNAISGTIIADGAITSTHLAANCVDSSELVTGSIDTIHIAANQVTATKIVTNGVLTRHISDDQITADKLANSINTDIATGPAALPKAGGTMTGNISLGDNNKAIFGAGSDLQIFHDASNSYIQSTTGNFNLTTDGGNEFALTAVNNGAVSLYYNGSAKIATTNTGIKIGAGGHPVDTDADDIVVMNTSGASGITISAQNNSVSSLRFGDSDLARSGMFYYNLSLIHI